MRKRSLPGVVLGSLLMCWPLAVGAGQAEEITQMQASRKAVAAACAVIKGVAIGTTEPNGPYGCISEGGWIRCDESGFCVGARSGDAKPGPRQSSGQS